MSDVGRAQVEVLRDRLASTGELRDATALYASVMARAVETAAIIAPAVGGHGVIEDCDFCEHHPGEGDGMRWDEYEQRWPALEKWDPMLGRGDGGETWTEMSARVERGLDRLVERHPGETVVVACHGGVIVQSMFRWLGLEPGGSDRAWISPVNTSLTEWRYGPNPYAKGTLEIELVRFNDHAHVIDVTT